MTYWEQQTDEELERQLKEARKRCWQAREKKDRAIAHKTVAAIEKEQARRFEHRFGLE